ncbi:TPA: hypothetical protein HA270_05380 [Candidatus Woesearchaeota archaeon]|nr:hypothetical protein [Candidatus Woesearchaeota archaeon]
MTNAFSENDFVGNTVPHKPIYPYPSKIQLMAIQRACLLPPLQGFSGS